jgi:predicted small metal-binding protein
MKHVSCSCGFVASAETAEGLLDAVEAHIAASHGAERARAAENARRNALGAELEVELAGEGLRIEENPVQEGVET